MHQSQVSPSPGQSHLSSDPSYSYCINPACTKDSIIRELRRFRGRFKSVTEMKIRLMEEFEEHMPGTTKFSLGYIEGRQSTKRWICCEDDLNAMYTAYATCPGKEILLWCDGRGGEAGDEEQPKSKRRKGGDSDDVLSKCEETEQCVVDIAEELKELHEDKLKLSEVQYHLCMGTYVGYWSTF